MKARHIVIVAKIVVVNFLTLNLDAQGWTWAEQMGSVNEDFANAICNDGSGNVFLSTRIFFPFGVFGSDTIPVSGLYDIFLTKIDINGNNLWTKRAGGYNPDGGLESADDVVYESNTQSILVAGSMRGSGKVIGNCELGGEDIAFLSKLDMDGNCTWAVELANFGSPSMLSIATDNAGHVYLTGNTKYVFYFKDTLAIQPGGFLAKLRSSDGTLIWIKKILEPGGSLFDLTYKNSKLFIGGGTGINKLILDGATFTCLDKDAFISQFDTSGYLIWVRTMGGPKKDFGGSVEVDNEGNIYTCGIFQDSIYFNKSLLTNGNRKDLFIAKYSNDGSVIWIKQYRATGSLNATYPFVSDNGNIYHIGSFSGDMFIGDRIISARTESDMFISEFGQEGNLIGIVQIGNLSSGGITVDNSGRFHIAGTFVNSVSFDEKTLTSIGDRDVFIAHHDAISITPELPKDTQHSLLIYANPTTGKCTITIPEEFFYEQHLTLQLFDMNGKLLENVPVTMQEGKIKMNIEAQAKGMYHVTLSNGEKVYRGKVVFE